MTTSSDHSRLVNDILVGLHKELPGYGNCWRNETGMGAIIETIKQAILIAVNTRNFSKAWKHIKFIKYGLKGSADIIGMTRNGHFLAIEAKTGQARQSKIQRNFQAMVNKNNAHYFVCRSVKQAIDSVKQVLEERP